LQFCVNDFYRRSQTPVEVYTAIIC